MKTTAKRTALVGSKSPESGTSIGSAYSNLRATKRNEKEGERSESVQRPRGESKMNEGAPSRPAFRSTGNEMFEMITTSLLVEREREGI